MMTSNRPIEEWGKLLSDVPAAGAILDRLLHTPRLSRSTGAQLQTPANRQTKSNLTTSFENLQNKT
jgi:DNA replication protein DnaC